MSEGKDDCWTFSGCDPSLSKINANFADLGRVCDLPNIPSADFPRVDADVSFPPNWRINLTGDGTITITPEGSGSGSGESGSGSGGSGSGESGSGSGSGSDDPGGSGSGSGSDDPGGSESGSGGSGSGGGGSGSGDSGSGESGSGSGSGGSGSGSGGSGSEGSGDSGSGDSDSGSGSGKDNDGSGSKKSHLRLSFAIDENNVTGGFGWSPCCELPSKYFSADYNHHYYDYIDVIAGDVCSHICEAQARIQFNGVVVEDSAKSDGESFADTDLLLNHEHCCGNFTDWRPANGYLPILETWNPRGKYNACDLSELAESDADRVLAVRHNVVDTFLSDVSFPLIYVAPGALILPLEIKTEVVGSSHPSSYTTVGDELFEQLKEAVGASDVVAVPAYTGKDLMYHLRDNQYAAAHNSFEWQYYRSRSSSLTDGLVEDVRLPDNKGDIASFKKYFVTDNAPKGTTPLEKYIANYAEYFKQHIFNYDSNDVSNDSSDIFIPISKLFFRPSRFSRYAINIPSGFYFPSSLNDPFFYNVLTLYTMYIARFTSEETKHIQLENTYLKSFMNSASLGDISVGCKGVSDWPDFSDYAETKKFRRWYRHTLTPDGEYYEFSRDDEIPDDLANNDRWHKFELERPPDDQLYPEYNYASRPDGGYDAFLTGFYYYYFVEYRMHDGVTDLHSSVTAKGTAPSSRVWAKCISGNAYVGVDTDNLFDSNDSNDIEEKTVPYGNISYVLPYRLVTIKDDDGNNEDVWQQVGTTVDVELLFDMPCIDWTRYDFSFSISEATLNPDEEDSERSTDEEDNDDENDYLDDDYTPSYSEDPRYYINQHVLNGSPVETDDNPHKISITYEELYKRYCITCIDIFNPKHNTRTMDWEMLTLCYEIDSTNTKRLVPAIYPNGKLHVYSFVSHLSVSGTSVEIKLSRQARLLSEEEAEKYYYFNEPEQPVDRRDKWLLDKRKNGFDDDKLRKLTPKHPRLK